jgi:hypothetical protein
VSPHLRLRSGVIAALALLAASGSLAVACRGGSSPAPTATAVADDVAVRTLIEDEFASLRRSDWSAVYDAYAPAFRASCPYDRFEQSELASVQGLDPTQIDVTNVKVTVNGDTASATYVYVYGGETVSTVSDASPDLFIKVEGRWYDAPDAYVNC